MRPFAAIAAVLLACCALPAAAYADGRPAMPTTPLVHYSRASGRHHLRHVRRHRWQRRWAAWVAPAPRIPVYFAWMIPSPLNPGYDRAMVLLLRSPAVSGLYTDDPGYPATPVVAGAPYQRQMCCDLLQYDSITGQYIQLSQTDAARMPPPPPLGGVPIPLPAP